MSQQPRLPSNHALGSNPAQQLLDLVPAHRVGELKDKNLFEAWSVIFGIPTRHAPILYYAIGQTSRLPTLTKIALTELLGDRSNKYLGWVEPVQKVLSSRNLESSFGNVVNALDAERRNIIDICSDQISTLTGHVKVGSPELEKIKELRDSIYRSALVIQNDTSLPIRVRTFCNQHLDIIDRALVDLQVFGSTAAVSTFETSVGLAAINRPLVEEMKQRESGKKVIAVLATFTIFMATIHEARYILDVAKSAGSILMDAIDENSSPPGEGAE